MFDSLTDSISEFDTCAEWVGQGENYAFSDAPDIILHPFAWLPSGAVAFSIIRMNERAGEIINEVTFLAFPGMDVLRAIAVAHAGLERP